MRFQRARMSTSTYFHGYVVAVHSDQIARHCPLTMDPQNSCVLICRHNWLKPCPPPQLQRHRRLVDRNGRVSKTPTTRLHLTILSLKIIETTPCPCSGTKKNESDAAQDDGSAIFPPTQGVIKDIGGGGEHNGKCMCRVERFFLVTC